MSGIAAVLPPAGAPASPETLDAMLDVMQVRGPDGCDVWYGAAAAIGHLALHTTPESVDQRQPFVDPVCGVVVTMDGRVDNRDDLRAALGDRIVRNAADVCYVAAAYERWGCDAFRHLIGDFAVVLWDPREHRLVCARDVMGMRPLCYARGEDGSLLVASELRALFATGLVPTDVNPGRALEWVADAPSHPTETLYTSIHRLAPAHVLTAGNGGLRERRYWDLQPGPLLRYKTNIEYVEHARSLLDQAVRAQSRRVGGLAVSLSGGVDSSSLVALVAAQGIPCDALSLVFPGRPCDESAYIAEVSRATGIRSTVFPYAPAPVERYARSVREYGDLADHPNTVTYDRLLEWARANGVRVVFGGVGGDEWFTGSNFHHADWLRSGALWKSARQIAADVRTRGTRRASYDFINGCWCVLPPSVRRIVKRTTGGRQVVPDWVSSAAASRYALEERIAHRVQPRDGEMFTQADMRIVNLSGAQNVAEEADDRQMSGAGLEQRNPFYDRRLIEFAYTLPDEQLWLGRFRKRILRAAVPELPPLVRWRTDKAHFTCVIADAVRAHKNEGMPFLFDTGWVQPDVVSRMHREWYNTDNTSKAEVDNVVCSLWALRSIDQWLSQRSTRNEYERRTRTHAIRIE